MACRKTCSYKNCKSDNADPNCTETFFAFPRDEIRYKQWMTLSRTMDEKPVKYLCSKHFDHKKYMSLKPRRKLLLSTAVPFPYQSDSDDDTGQNDISEEKDENYEIDSNDESSLITVVKIESHKSSEGDEEIELLENDEWPDTWKNTVENSVQQINKTYIKVGNNLQNCQYRGRKRKIKDILTSSHLDDNELCNERININEYENDLDIIDDNSDDVDDGNHDNNYLESSMPDNDLITHPDIKTFFINDEEYIKLPKSLYCCEKRQLLQEISYYKRIILDFKKKLSNVKL